MYKLATKLRGGDQVAWSTNMIMQYVPYLSFEREVWKAFRARLKAGEFDIVHRITPMSPTLPRLYCEQGEVPVRDRSAERKFAMAQGIQNRAKART